MDYSETIFKMDSLDLENSKSEVTPPKVEATDEATPIKEDAPSENKSGKKKRRKRSMMKKKLLQKKSASVSELSTVEAGDSLQDSVNDGATDRSSLDSNASEPELKEIQWVGNSCFNMPSFFCPIVYI